MSDEKKNELVEPVNGAGEPGQTASDLLKKPNYTTYNNCSRNKEEGERRFEVAKEEFMSMDFSIQELCEHLSIASGETLPLEKAGFVKDHFDRLGYEEIECEWAYDYVRGLK